MALNADEQKVVDEAPNQLLIGGEWRDATGGGKLAIEDPSTGETFCEVADGTPDDAKAAMDAACDAQADWAATPPNERSEILYNAFKAIGEHADDLALLMTLEMGKSVAESKAELTYAAEFFRWFAGEALRIDGYYKNAGNGASRVLVMRQPVGPCYFITPWNFPNAMGTRKIGPALAAGCTMVVKPAQQTPLSMLALAKLLEDCGLPGGVLNVVTSKKSGDVSEPIIGDPRLRKLSFTGSTEVGRKLIAQAADNVLKVSMELGGNAPFLVFEDADVDDAIEGAMIAKMRNVGEACTSANRFHVHESLAEEFAEKLAKKMGAMKVGRGTEEGTEVGPLIDATSATRWPSWSRTRSPRARRASPAVGARGRGLLLRADGPQRRHRRRARPDEEIFGPVAPIATFSSDEEAIAAANKTEYGLVSYVYTSDLKRALRVCEALETGMIGLNQGMVSNAGAPFGGVKQSGNGREGGNEGIHEYLETKYVAVNL